MMWRTIVLAVAVAAIANVRMSNCSPLVSIEVKIEVDPNCSNSGCIKAGNQLINLSNTGRPVNEISQTQSSTNGSVPYQFGIWTFFALNGTVQTQSLLDGSKTQLPSMEKTDGTDRMPGSTSSSITEEPTMTTIEGISQPPSTPDTFTTPETLWTTDEGISQPPSTPDTFTTPETLWTTVEGISQPPSTPDTFTTPETLWTTDEGISQPPSTPDTSTTSQPPVKKHYEWVKYDGELRLLPGMVRVGRDSDGSTLVVARARHFGDLIPGKAKPEQSAAWVSHGKGEYETSDFEVLMMPIHDWVSASNGKVPSGAIEGGKTSNGETLYIARTTHDGVSVSGKVHPSLERMLYPYKGKEYSTRNYEVLVESPYKWVPYKEIGGFLPEMVRVRNNDDLTVSRGHHEGGLLPGMAHLTANHVYTIVTYNGKDVVLNDFEMLLMNDYKWVAASDGSVPDKAVKGGYAKSGETLYVGRTEYKNYGYYVGKVHPSNKRMYFSAEHMEKESSTYEVLVAK